MSNTGANNSNKNSESNHDLPNASVSDNNSNETVLEADTNTDKTSEVSPPTSISSTIMNENDILQNAMEYIQSRVHNETWLFGSLNVHTLAAKIYGAGDNIVAQIPEYNAAFARYNMKVIALQETRIPGQIAIGNDGPFLYHFSGGTERQLGVGIAVSIRWKNLIKHVEPVNDRTIWMLLEIKDNDKKIGYIIFSAYAPTENASKEKRHLFWKSLYETQNKAKRMYPKAIVMFGGDSMLEWVVQQLMIDLLKMF